MTLDHPVYLADGELPFGCVLACENNHAIKMKQGVGDDHGQGSALYTTLIFIRHKLRMAQLPFLIPSFFIASISHTGNSFEIDNCAMLKALNGQQR